jgi:hypothetical protein
MIFLLMQKHKPVYAYNRNADAFLAAIKINIPGRR